MLKKINSEQKITNRNLQSILNIILMMILVKENREAEEENDETRKKITRLGMILVTITQFMLLAIDIIEIVKRRKQQ